MLKKYKFILADKLQNIFYYLIRAYSRTFRLRVENEKPWLDHLRGGGRILLCCWHQQFFSAVRYFKNYAPYHPCLLYTSRAHETPEHLVCRLLLEKKKKKQK